MQKHETNIGGREKYKLSCPSSFSFGEPDCDRKRQRPWRKFDPYQLMSDGGDEFDSGFTGFTRPHYPGA